MKSKTRFIPAIISLGAAFLTCIVTAVNRYTTLEAMIAILVVLIAFYMLGSIVKSIADKHFVIEEEEETEEDTENEESTEEEKEAEDTQGENTEGTKETETAKQ